MRYHLPPRSREPSGFRPISIAHQWDETCRFRSGLRETLGSRFSGLPETAANPACRVCGSKVPRCTESLPRIWPLGGSHDRRSLRAWKRVCRILDILATLERGASPKLRGSRDSEQKAVAFAAPPELERALIAASAR